MTYLAKFHLFLSKCTSFCRKYSKEVIYTVVFQIKQSRGVNTIVKKYMNLYIAFILLPKNMFGCWNFKCSFEFLGLISIIYHISLKFTPICGKYSLPVKTYQSNLLKLVLLNSIGYTWTVLSKFRFISCCDLSRLWLANANKYTL